MTIFVAGATGFTGRALVQQLAEAGLAVVAHVRPDSSRLEQWRETFTGWGASVDTTAWREADMAATLERLQPERVFALLGTTRKRMRADGGDYQSIDFGLTRLLIDAAAAAGSVQRLVYLSAEGVRPGTRNPYLRARVDAEAHLAASGVPWTAARPSFITGARDEKRPGEHYGAQAADGLLTVVGLFGGRGVRARYRSTDNATLAAALIRVSADPAYVDQVVRSEGLR